MIALGATLALVLAVLFLALAVLLYTRHRFSDRARAERLRAVVAEARAAREKLVARAAATLPVMDEPRPARLSEHLSQCHVSALKVSDSLTEIIQAERLSGPHALIAARDRARRLALHLHGLLGAVAPGLAREQVGGGQRGFATVAVAVLLLGVVSLGLAAFMTMGASEARIGGNLYTQKQAEFLAESGAEFGLEQVRLGSTILSTEFSFLPVGTAHVTAAPDLTGNQVIVVSSARVGGAVRVVRLVAWRADPASEWKRLSWRSE